MAKLLITGNQQGEDLYLLSPHHVVLNKDYTLHTADRNYLIISSIENTPYNTGAYDIWQGHYSRSLVKDLLYKFNIRTPKFFMSRGTYPTWVHSIFNSYKRLAIKGDKTARGIRKATMNFDQYLKMIDIIRKQVKTFEEDGKTLTKEAKQFFRVLNIKEFGDYRNDDEKYGLFEDFFSNEFHVEEVIDIAREFRVHYVRDVKSRDFTGYERFGYSLNYNASKVKDVMRDISTCVPRALLDKIKQLGDSTKSVTLSFDVYQDKDGNWGVIEFASNYSLDGCDSKLVSKLSQQYNNAIDNMYKEKFCLVEMDASQVVCEDDYVCSYTNDINTEVFIPKDNNFLGSVVEVLKERSEHTHVIGKTYSEEINSDKEVVNFRKEEKTSPTLGSLINSDFIFLTPDIILPYCSSFSYSTTTVDEVCEDICKHLYPNINDVYIGNLYFKSQEDIDTLYSLISMLVGRATSIENTQFKLNISNYDSMVYFILTFYNNSDIDKIVNILPNAEEVCSYSTSKNLAFNIELDKVNAGLKTIKLNIAFPTVEVPEVKDETIDTNLLEVLETATDNAVDAIMFDKQPIGEDDKARLNEVLEKGRELCKEEPSIETNDFIVYKVLSVKDGLVTIEPKEPIENGTKFEFSNGVKGLWSNDVIVVLGKTDSINIGDAVVCLNEILLPPEIPTNNIDIEEVKQDIIKNRSTTLVKDDIIYIPYGGILCKLISNSELDIDGKHYYYKLNTNLIKYIMLDLNKKYLLRLIEKDGYVSLMLCFTSNDYSIGADDAEEDRDECFNNHIQVVDDLECACIMLYRDKHYKQFYIREPKLVLEEDYLEDSNPTVLNDLLIPLPIDLKDHINIAVELLSKNNDVDYVLEVLTAMDINVTTELFSTLSRFKKSISAIDRYSDFKAFNYVVSNYICLHKTWFKV